MIILVKGKDSCCCPRTQNIHLCLKDKYRDSKIERSVAHCWSVRTVEFASIKIQKKSKEKEVTVLKNEIIIKTAYVAEIMEKENRAL